MIHRMVRTRKRGLGGVLAMAIVVMAPGGWASEAGSRRVEQAEERAGFRCEHRNELREVARNTFVVDRVTECAPRGLRSERLRPEARELARFATSPSTSPSTSTSTAPSTVPPIAPSTELVDTPSGRLQVVDRDRRAVVAAERRVEWRSDRTRLANAQFDRSVRVWEKGFQRGAR